MKHLLNHHLRGDRTIWMVALLLGLTSMLAVYSACAWMAWKHAGGTLRILFKQVFMLALGGGIMYAVSKAKYTMYSKLSQLLLGITILLLGVTLVFGSSVNGASRWLMIPGIGLTFQTSDLARVVIVVYLARVLGKHREEPWTFREVLLRLGLPIAAVCGLILPANFSTAALLGLTCFVVMFIAQVPIKHLASLTGIAVGAFAVLLIIGKAKPELLPRAGTWEKRAERFFAGTSQETAEDRDANYQANQAKVAIANGGLLPNGPGSGTSRNYMPHPESDMIFAFIIEEYGSIIGGLGIMLLYLILLFRAMRIARKCEKPFGQLTAIGLALGLVLQALVNMAVSVNLLPVTGQPLPIVSLGGTSLWFTCVALGIIISVSRSVYDTEAQEEEQQRPRTASPDGPAVAIA
jgi:cell division protein FtsW